MKSAFDQFRQNVDRARSLAGIGNSLEGLTAPVVDVSDLYRASLVHGVSALDHLVHELARLGMLEIFRGTRPETGAYLSFKVSLSSVKVAIADTSTDTWFDQAIRDAHSWQSFQRPDRIADAIRLMSPAPLWESVANRLAMTPDAAKRQLNAVVDRRNKIAHEADMDPTNPGERWPIDYLMISHTLDYLQNVATAIFDSV